MQYISINSIGDYPEDFLIAKVDVERHLIETEAIEKRMKLEEFIIYLNIQNTIYMKGQKSIAFSIQQGQSDKYVFYSLLDQDENGELFESFKKKLEHLKYNFLFIISWISNFFIIAFSIEINFILTILIIIRFCFFITL